MNAGVLHINGEPVARERVEDFTLAGADGKTTAVRQWRETLPGGVSYRTIDLEENGPLDNTPIVAVPDRPLFRHWRQPRQFDRQPPAALARYGAGGQHHRPRGTHLFFHRGGRKPLALLALAAVGALGSDIHAGALTLPATAARPIGRAW